MGSIPIRFRHRPMPRKRPKKFSAVKEPRRRARATLGAPPPTKVVKDKRRKPPKHKKKLEDENLLQD